MAPAAGSGFSPGEAWGYAWRVVTKKFGAVAVPIAVGSIVLSIPIGIVYGVMTVGMQIAAEQGLIDLDLIQLVSAVMGLAVYAVSIFAGAFMLGGITTVALKACRGQPTSVGDVFSGGKYMGTMLVAYIVLTIAVLIGMLLCVIPGYILAFGLALFAPIIVDQGLGGVDALKKSWAMTKGHKLSIFLFYLIGIFVMLAGYIACAVGALLVSLPMMYVGLAYIYLRIKGEQVVEPA